MTELIPIFTRIVLRYASGALVAWGLIAPEDARILAMDPDLAMLVGAGIAALVEAAYALAKRKGWAT